MAEQLATLRQKGGGKATMELINTPNVALTTSNKTINLLKPLSDYEYIIFRIWNTTNDVYDGVFGVSVVRPILQVVTPTYFKTNGSCVGYGASGNDGALSQKLYTLTYKDDTSLYAKWNYTTADRYLYVYGIK